MTPQTLNTQMTQMMKLEDSRRALKIEYNQV